ncbi:MAG: NADH-quinone oxidoreductase subunit L [Verrucomicrobia bacterium]|nr:NADH-quinone oxidoreductase subunit L [Verrucomicrobiota bacterium]
MLYTALFLPLAGFLFLLSFSSVLSRRVINIVGPLTILGSFICFCTLCNTDVDVTLFTWIAPLNANFSLHLDTLSHLMTLIITGVGFLIHAYSTGYMEHDKDLARYFCVMNLFIFSMLLLVLASNLLLLFVGWEGVGVASYLLIGYWYQKNSAQKAAKKAFVVNRIGDLGLLLAIFMSLQLYGTTDMATINSHGVAPTLLGLFLFWGACGKSAQMPLHTWLPDAMEGPTPVSALIHAATMVTAGVYLVVRMHFVFDPTALMVVATVGGITSLFAALSATSQTDLKRVLAYSTLSQLGLMFLAAGCGAYVAAMFHLTMHAFVKALLFLAAGNVIHMLHDVTEMSQMGGLAKYLKKTNIFFLLGALSMAGIPPLAIFFSKDILLEEISSHTFFYLLGLTVSLLTAYYLMRAYMLTFQGPLHAKAPEHDAPKSMMIPVAILALLSCFAGFLQSIHFSWSVWVSIAIAVLGVAIGVFSNKVCAKFFYEAFYINQLYDACVVKPLRAFSQLAGSFFEPKLFVGSMDEAASSASQTAKLLQLVQTGSIRSYIAWIVVGASFVILYLIGVL